MSRPWAALMSACLAVLGACSQAYDYDRQEVVIRLRADEDALSILEVQSGISAARDKADAVAALEAALAGTKRYPPEMGFIAVDFDDEEYCATLESEAERAAFREFAANLHVAEVHVYQDARQQLCFARHTRIEHLGRTLEIVNAWLNRTLREDFSRQDADPRDRIDDFPIFDVLTRDAFRSAASNGHAWLSLRDDALVLDVPMSAANAARCLEALAAGRLNGSDARLLTQASGLELRDGHALVSFGGPSRPLVRFESDPESVPAEPSIDEHVAIELRNAGWLILRSADLTRLRAELETGPAPASLPK